MTNIIKMLACVFALSLSTACMNTGGYHYEGESTVQQTETVQADVLCAKYGDDRVFVSSLTTDPHGLNNPNHSGILAQPAKPDCSGFARDAAGNILPAFFIAGAHAVDMMRDVTNGAVSAVGGAFQGAVSSAIIANADQGCAGCVPQVTNVTAVAHQTTDVVAGLEANLASGGPGPCHGCGAPTE